MTHWKLAALFCGILALSAASHVFARSGSEQDPQESAAVPWQLIGLQRNADAVARASESLESLLSAWEEGSLSDEQARVYILERTRIIKQLTKRINDHRDVRRLDQMKSSSRKEEPQTLVPPRNLEEALALSGLAADLGRQIKTQVGEIAGDTQTFEVHVGELTRPTLRILCRDIRKASELLEDFAKTRDPKAEPKK